MALIWIEGFEKYGTTTAVDITALLQTAGWYVYCGTELTDQGYQRLRPVLMAGRFGGYAVTGSAPSPGSAYTSKLCRPITDSTVVIGFALWYDSMRQTVANVTIMDAFGDTNNSHNMVSFGAGNNGSLSVGRKAPGGQSVSLLTVSLGQPVVTPSSWHYVELKVYFHATQGTVEIRLDGVSVGTVANVNTSCTLPSVATRWIEVDLQGIVQYGGVDDLYILDGTGSVNNDFLGPCFVSRIAPASDATANWTPSTAGSHFSLVNESPATDTGNVSSSTPDTTDLYDYGNLTNVRGIVGVQVDTVCKSQGQNHLKVPIVSGATQDDGTSVFVVASSDVSVVRISETDPATGLPWTLAALNAAQFGVKVG